MDRLWSPWRLPYVTGEKAEEGCVFCRACTAEGGALVVHRGAAAFVILNKFPYNNGHLMVVPVRHVSDLASLSRDELVEVAQLVQASESVLRRAYAPHGINVGANIGKPAGAGIVDHVHVHLVPRWNGDTNFMTVVGETRVLPEALEDTARRLQPLFDALVPPA
ncbi:MAG: HIT domain-containing protein [Acidimicrobiia bacterium]|nr:HIT domain-containing protein [Acidimicrobiia bacterium]